MRRIFYYVSCFLIFTLAFFTNFYFIRSQYLTGSYLSRSLTLMEIVCYIELGLVILTIFLYTSACWGKRRVFRHLFCAFASLIFISLVCVINNYFHYIQFNSAFFWEEPIIPFSHFLVKDITYHIGVGLWRYPIFFLLFYLCAEFSVIMIGVVRYHAKRVE